MKANEIIVNENVNLFEINMSPSSLRQLANNINARAGMEFEMAVPTTRFKRTDASRLDYDYNERTGSIENIIDFFSNANNTEGDLEQLKEQLQQDFQRYIKKQLAKIVAEYVDDRNLFDEDVAYEKAQGTVSKTNPNEQPTSPEYKRKVTHEVIRLRKEFINNIVAEKDPDSELGNIFQDALDSSDRRDPRKDSESEWLGSTGLIYMDDIRGNYDINWPYYKTTVDLSTIGDSFGAAIGRSVNIGDRYHSATREEGIYALEPDSSIEPAVNDDAGLEFISPPLPLGEMLDDLKKVVAWAKSHGCYTNNSTGLHMNVSIAGLKGTLDNLDFVKLVLLLGDEHVSQQFDRLGNYYAKSSLGKLKNFIRQKQAANPADIKQFLDFMRFRLQDMASKILSSSLSWGDKYFSVHAKEGYIEFRSPGGDWLNSNLAKLESTLLRFAVALDAAMDPEKYRQEYLTKLYKLLQVKNTKDPLSYFAQYSAGKLTFDDLKFFISSFKDDIQPKASKLPGSKQKPELQWGIHAPDISRAAASSFNFDPNNFRILKKFTAPNLQAATDIAKRWADNVRTMDSYIFSSIGRLEVIQL